LAVGPDSRSEIEAMKVIGHRSLASLVGTIITLGWAASMGLLVLFVCALAASPWVDPPDLEIGLAVPAAFRLEPEPRDIRAPDVAVTNIHLEDAWGSLRFSPRASGVAAAGLLPVIAGLVVTLWVLAQLRAVFGTLRVGRPFVAANATRIRRIAYAVIAGEIVRTILVYEGMRYAMAHFSAPGVRFEARWDLDFTTIVSGLIILIIAEVFREGTRLAEEQSLTV
jgi:hypothetical protein